MDYLSKSVNILKKKGALELLKKGISFVYNRRVAPLLPRTSAIYNGVNVKDARLFDSVFPWRTKNKPYWEFGTVRAINGYVDKGDSIVIVGGGLGVTAVKAAQKAGHTGEVTVYEGSAKEINNLQDTIKRNDLYDRINTIHGIVGPLISISGEEGNATRVAPEELPECDVLELDCEGAEVEILEKLTIRPRAIVVESHGMNGAPSSKIENLLEEMSYSIVSKEVAEKTEKDYAIKNDIYVLVAERR